MKTVKIIERKDNHSQESSKVDEDSPDEQQERSHTQVGWSWHQEDILITSEDDTSISVSGDEVNKEFYSDSSDDDSLPSLLVSRFIAESSDKDYNFIDDESSDEEDSSKEYNLRIIHSSEDESMSSAIPSSEDEPSDEEDSSKDHDLSPQECFAQLRRSTKKNYDEVMLDSGSTISIYNDKDLVENIMTALQKFNVIYKCRQRNNQQIGEHNRIRKRVL